MEHHQPMDKLMQHMCGFSRTRSSRKSNTRDGDGHAWQPTHTKEAGPCRSPLAADLIFEYRRPRACTHHSFSSLFFLYISPIACIDHRAVHLQDIIRILHFCEIVHVPHIQGSILDKMAPADMYALPCFNICHNERNIADIPIAAMSTSSSSALALLVLVLQSASTKLYSWPYTANISVLTIADWPIMDDH